MPFTLDIAAFGRHATIFVSWQLLAFVAVLVIGAVLGTKLFISAN
jgi:hypothetical protein